MRTVARIATAMNVEKCFQNLGTRRLYHPTISGYRSKGNEISQPSKNITTKKQLVLGWHKALAAVNPKPPGQKKKAA